MVEVVKGLRAIRIADADGLDTEVYLLECEEGLTLVDVGFTEICYRNLKSELKSMGSKWSDINRIIITHAHGDHIVNLPRVLSKTKADVLIGIGDESQLFERTGVKADEILRNKDIISDCGNIEIIHVPGHSPGNICLYIKKNKAVIAGDTIFGDSEGNIIAPPKKYSSNVQLARSNLKILLDYDFDTLLLSHGANIIKEGKEKVNRLVQELT